MKMKIGIIISTNESEIVWNAFRFANISLNSNHKTKIFLINKGVEIEGIKDEKYKVKNK